MTRIKSGDAASTLHLSPWFDAALAQRKHRDGDFLCDFDDSSTVPDDVWAEPRVRIDIPEIIALIRLCAALPRGQQATIKDLFDPFQITVFEAGSDDLVQPVEDALVDLLIPALRQGARHLPKPQVLSPTGSSYARNPQRKIEEFTAKLQKGLSAELPALVVVRTLNDLPDGVASAVTTVVPLPQWSRGMMMRLHEVVQGRAKLIERRKAFTALPPTDLLAKLPVDDLVIAARQTSVTKIAAVLVDIAARAKPSAEGNALAEVKGLGATRAQLEQLAEDMKLWSAGSLPWPDIPRGVLLFGPPGTGKTFTARQLARQIGGHFVSTSYADWQKAGHLGDFLAAMSKSFEEARKHAPSVLFIDEIDSFGDRAAARGDNAGYIRSAVNGLLEQLDGARTSEGVLVVAACNNLNGLDSALIRSGRFDLKLPIELPDKRAMTDILRAHVGPYIDPAALEPVAAHLVGHSGADVTAVIRQAHSLARAQRRDLQIKDLWSAALLLAPLASSTDLQRAAIHEAGHAVTGYFGGLGTPLRAEIRASGGHVLFPAEHAYPTEPVLEARLVAMLGGRAAETVVLGSASSGAGGDKDSDLAQATLLAARVEAQLGLGSGGLLWRPVDHDSLPDLLTDPDVRACVSKRLDRALQKAQMLLKANHALVLRIADALLDQRQLTQDQLSSLLKEAAAGNAQTADHMSKQGDEVSATA